jgi:hypothetical protein
MPITFNTGLGNYGRFGNSLWQIAFLNSMAKRYGTEWSVPSGWKYAKYFETEFPSTDYKNIPDVCLKEPSYKYNQDFWDNHSGEFRTKNVDVLGYFQNEKYFDPNETRSLLRIKKEYVDQVKEKYKDLFTRPTIAVGVRRTDYLTSGQYYNLPVLYYILALQKFEYQNCNIVFITDDTNWCWFHFQSLSHAFFPKFDSDIEQFICGTLITEGWITANSTFHWWSAYLSNCNKVIQPAHLFAGDLLKREGNHNFYIESGRFEIFNHEPHRIDLKDVTITIPVKYDHDDRKKNLESTVCLLQKNFNVNIIIGEQGSDKFQYFDQWAKYIKFDYPEFHRTAMLNRMAEEATTDIVINYDADVNVPPMQLLKAVELLRTNNADFVYPYEYLFVRVPKSKHNDLFKTYDLFEFAHIKNGVDTKTRPSVGGMVLINRRKFLECGGENEAFISYCPEDIERFERFTKLGLKCKRTRGRLYHLDHYVGINSSKSNPFYEAGVKELDKVRSMDKEELKEYVLSWPWYKGYTEDYRLEISPTATQSAKEVFNQLSDWHVYNGGSVLDLGCGVGSWGVDLPDYTGVDFNVPQEMILVKNHINHDLREPLKLDKKYDLVMSVEVAEHLEGRYAETFVDSLCNAAKEYILFSAAIPYQGGFNHVNEQWQSYWVEKFDKRGFYPYMFDLREVFYDNDKIDLWYRNNLILFSTVKYDYKYKKDFIHPKYYEQIARHLKG